MPLHSRHMHRALELARYQNGRTGANPSVGCVIVDRDGAVLSEGATGDGGTLHAEETALRHLPIGAASGGVAYVTLEPCRKRSAGGVACSDHLVTAGVETVYISTLDPHPNGAGGAARLRGSGICVKIGLLKDESDRFYAEFFASVK